MIRAALVLAVLAGPASAAEEVRWQTLPGAFDAARKSRKPVLVLVWADW